MSRSAPTYDNVRAPPGYIAGRGRGAVGFQTRSDIGNASADKPKEASLDNSQFDNFSGYSGSIVSQSEYDREDEDADKIYEAIDQRMQARRKRKRDEDDSKVCLLVILMFSPPSISLHIPPPPSPPFLSIITQPNLSVSHLY